MARKINSGFGDDEQVEVLRHGGPDEVKLQPIVNDAPVRANALDRNGDVDESQMRRVRRFRVERGGSFLDPGGYRTRVPVGKEIDELNYDIRRLRTSGIQVVDITNEEPAQYIEH